MAYPFDLDDVAFLRSAAGADALAGVAALALTAASRIADVAAVRRAAGDRYAAAVLETAVLRRRAAAKLDADRAAGWLFTDDALQQATPAPVARHRAARLAGAVVHDVTCSIGADLAELAGTAALAIGSDLDPVRLAMAGHNLGPHAHLVRADALRPVSRAAVVFADPARRDEAGRRRWRAADLVPSLTGLAERYAGADRPGLVAKCAPGMDFDLVPWAAEVELVSLDGGVREACLWSAALATAGVRRRATVLTSAGARYGLTDADDDTCPVRQPGPWLVNPDGAVVRAGLVRQYAARHGLGQLDQRIAYLTGDRPPPGVRAFRVLEHGPYQVKALRAALRRHDAGAVEILVRGLDVDPDALRPRLRPRGTAALTVVLTRIGRAPTAFVCRAVQA